MHLSGLSLRWNRTDPQLQQSQEDTLAQEAGQQDTGGFSELAGSGPDHADHGLTKMPASPAVAGLSRPNVRKRGVKTENIFLFLFKCYIFR